PRECVSFLLLEDIAQKAHRVVHPLAVLLELLVQREREILAEPAQLPARRESGVSLLVAAVIRLGATLAGVLPPLAERGTFPNPAFAPPRGLPRLGAAAVPRRGPAVAGRAPRALRPGRGTIASEVANLGSGARFRADPHLSCPRGVAHAVRPLPFRVGQA